MHLSPLILQNDTVRLVPLQSDDFEKLYSIAADPLIWEQHPTPDRYKREVFQAYFDSGIASKSAYLIYNVESNDLIGCTRFYPVEDNENTIHIGYTFFKRSSWGTNHNRKTKELMLNYAFQHVESVLFQIGTTNFRSQKAIEKLGAKKIGEVNIAYTTAEKSEPNFIYEITKDNFRLDN
jgi:RimJ/RimL family protein N-acetyltransferase